MRAVVTTPFIPISRNLAGHRAAQGVIYADQLKQAGIDVTVNMSLDLYIPDDNEFDELYAYHGNDWGGSLNIFGGVRLFPYIHNFVNFSNFRGRVHSLVIPFPDYHGLLKSKIDSARADGREVNPEWDGVDWDNLLRMQREADVVDPNLVVPYPRVAVGDSHAICMYRPGWMVNAVPFKTLYGALNVGLDKFVRFDERVPRDLEAVELYFGNIDVRHHLLRRPDPEAATRELAARYMDEADTFSILNGDVPVTIYELLPIEDESRSIPKTGWYEGTPFYGSRADRDRIRLLFRDELKCCENRRVRVFEWVDGLMNRKGELGFEYMEKPKSIHLSREFYPHWQGREYNAPRGTVNRGTHHASLEGLI
jgi:hypothetical protein